jgi:hypothetical protein
VDIHTVSTIIGIAVGAGIKHAWDTHWRLKAALKQPNAAVPSPVALTPDPPPISKVIVAVPNSPRPSVAANLAAQVEAIRAQRLAENSPPPENQDMIMPGLPRVHQ